MHLGLGYDKLKSKANIDEASGILESMASNQETQAGPVGGDITPRNRFASPAL